MSVQEVCGESQDDSQIPVPKDWVEGGILARKSREKVSTFCGGEDDLSVTGQKPTHDFFISNIVFFSFGFPFWFIFYDFCFSAEVSYLFIHEEVIFLHILDYIHNSCFKVLIYSFQHLDYLRLCIHGFSSFLCLGHVFLFLHMWSNFGLYPRHCASCVAETLDYVVFL